MNTLISQKYIHLLAALFFFVVICALFIVPTLALGQTTPQTGSTATPDPRASTIPASSVIGSYIGNMIISAGAMITGFGGALLNASINQFVLGINGWIGNGTPLGNSINNVWVLVRDICNLAFIFGFIYIGIRTIIDADSSSTKRMLASIIIGALLINFSLFFAKVIIDASNYISREIYVTLVDTSAGGTIASSFENAMGLSTLYNIQNAQEFAQRTSGGNIAFYFMATLFLIIAGFVFAAGAILLMIRFVVLVLILCFSPILFAATVFPATQEHASKLWKQLISYSFFAPVYLLLLVVSLNLLNGIVPTMRGAQTMASSVLGLGQNGVPVGNIEQAYGIFLSFGIALFFLIMSLQIATKFGVAGADRTIAFGNRMRGQVQSAIGRNTVGRGSDWLLKKYEAKTAKDAQSRAKMGFARRFVNNTGKFALSTVGVDDRSIRSTLKAGKEAKFGGSYSRADDKSYAEELGKRNASKSEQTKFKQAVEAGLMEGANDAAKIAMESAVAGASLKFLEELDQKEREKIVDLMTNSQFEGLQKSAELSDTDKAELSDARTNEVRRRVIRAGGVPNGVGGVAAAIHKASGKDLDALNYENDMLPNAGRLSSKQIDDMTLTPTAKSRLKDARKASLSQEFNDGAGAAALFGRVTNDAERAKLPTDILIQPAAAPFFTVNTLTKILDNDDITAEQRAIIKENVENAHMADGQQQRYNDFFDSPLGRRYG